MYFLGYVKCCLCRRYESLKHCKWVDEVVEEAPWVVDEAFIAKHQVGTPAQPHRPPFDACGALAEQKVLEGSRCHDKRSHNSIVNSRDRFLSMV